MSSPMTLDIMIDTAEDFARRVLLEKKQKQLMPSFLLIQPDDSAEIIQVELDFNIDLQKQLLRAKMRALMQEKGTIMYSFISEAWQSPEGIPPEKVKRDAQGIYYHSPDVPRPSQHPNRIEVVMVMATDGIRAKYKQWLIKRDYKGAIRDLVPDRDMEGDTVISPFADLLTRGHA